MKRFRALIDQDSVARFEALGRGKGTGAGYLAALLTTLAAFALYAGVGSKTTMGMGQVRATFDDRLKDVVHPDRTPIDAESSVCATGTREV